MIRTPLMKLQEINIEELDTIQNIDIDDIPDELEDKKRLYFKYKGQLGEKEIVNKLGLKDWELKYIKGI